jgi:hypothetical protein
VGFATYSTTRLTQLEHMCYTDRMQRPVILPEQRACAGAGRTPWLPATLFEWLLAAAVQLAALPPIYDETEMQRDHEIRTPLPPVGDAR